MKPSSSIFCVGHETCRRLVALENCSGCLSFVSGLAALFCFFQLSVAFEMLVL
jgi:hypothetical protein